MEESLDSLGRGKKVLQNPSQNERRFSIHHSLCFSPGILELLKVLQDDVIRHSTSVADIHGHWPRSWNLCLTQLAHQLLILGHIAPLREILADLSVEAFQLGVKGGLQLKHSPENSSKIVPILNTR